MEGRWTDGDDDGWMDACMHACMHGKDLWMGWVEERWMEDGGKSLQMDGEQMEEELDEGQTWLYDQTTRSQRDRRDREQHMGPAVGPAGGGESGDPSEHPPAGLAARRSTWPS